MGDALPRLFLSIGIALGLVSGQPDPSLFAKVALEDGPGGGRIVVSARVENAFAPGTWELVDSGTRVALRFSARLEEPSGTGVEAREIRAIRYDLRSGLYDVDFDGGKTAALVDPQAARTLASELPVLELGRGSQVPIGTRVVVRAEIGIIDSRGEWHGAPVLWNYSGPSAVLALGANAKGGK